MDCGEEDPIVLEFDHVRGEKIAHVARMLTTARPLQMVQAEVAKCEVRCANCHRRVTHQRRVKTPSKWDAIETIVYGAAMK